MYIYKYIYICRSVVFWAGIYLVLMSKNKGHFFINLPPGKKVYKGLQVCYISTIIDKYYIIITHNN